MRYFYGADRDLLQTKAIWWSCHLLHIIKTFLDLVLHLWRLSCLQVRAAQSKLFRARFHSLSGKPAPTFNHRAGPQLNSLQFVTGFAAMVCWKTQHGRKPLTVEVTSLLLLALPQALYYTSVRSSLWNSFLTRDILGPEAVCPLLSTVPKLILLPSTQTAKDRDTDRSNPLHSRWGGGGGLQKNEVGQSFLIRAGFLWSSQVFSLPSVPRLLRKRLQKLHGLSGPGKLHPFSVRSVQVIPLTDGVTDSGDHTADGESRISALPYRHFLQICGFIYLCIYLRIYPMIYRITVNLKEKNKQTKKPPPKPTQTTELLLCGH